MKDVAILYWSGTGNTEAMANAIAEGVQEKGANAALYTPDNYQEADLASYGAVALGCPAMGAEELEDTEFVPMYDAVKGQLGGKAVALFGSYGWGDGEWMRTWEDDIKGEGVTLAAESVIANDAPDDDAVTSLKALGAALAE